MVWMDDHDDNDDCDDDDDKDGRWLWLWTVCILVLWWWYDDSHWKYHPTAATVEYAVYTICSQSAMKMCCCCW